MQDAVTQEILKIIDRKRDDMNISVTKFCEEVEIARQTYYDYQNGKFPPGSDVFIRFIKYFNIDINPILYREENTNELNEPMPLEYKKKCKECEKKENEIKRQKDVIDNLNYCFNKLRSEKKCSSNENPKLAK